MLSLDTDLLLILWATLLTVWSWSNFIPKFEEITTGNKCKNECITFYTNKQREQNPTTGMIYSIEQSKNGVIQVWQHRPSDVFSHPGFISSQASSWLDLGASIPCKTFPVSVWITLTGRSLIWLLSSMGCKTSWNVRFITCSSQTTHCHLLLHTSHLHASEFTFILILFG